MTDTGTISERLGKIQEYAVSYFEVIYKTVFPFWLLPEVPSGGNILSGVFATILMTLARAQMSQPIDAATIGLVLAITIFVVLLICGILIVFDPNFAGDRAAGETGGQKRVGALRQIVSVVCVAITLGCVFIVLDKIFPWIETIFAYAKLHQWSGDGAGRAVASVAALGSCVVILTNTLLRIGSARFFGSPRMLVWSLVTFAVVVLGINIVVTPPLEF